MPDPVQTLTDLLTPVLAGAFLELVDVEVAGLGTAAATVRVLVELAPDHPSAAATGGRIDLDGVASATRLVDETLEAADPISGAYTLEVSSPGLERPLRTPAHFRRFVGTTVSVKTVAGTEGDRRVEGVLQSADAHDDGAITVAGRAIAYAAIERARTVFVWGPAPKPGKPGAKTGAKPASSKGAASRRADAVPSDSAAGGPE